MHLGILILLSASEEMADHMLEYPNSWCGGSLDGAFETGVLCC